MLLEIQSQNGKTMQQLGMLNGNYIVYHCNGYQKKVSDIFLFLKELYPTLQMYQFVSCVKKHKTIKLDNCYLVNVL